jgi:serine/threonine protein kinase
MSEEIEQHILQRFQILTKLGKGAYGVVWKAVDRKTNKVIALKKVNLRFEVNLRYLTHSITPLMLSVHIEKLSFCSN